MDHEIGHRHKTRKDERDGTREQADKNQQTAEKLQNARDAEKRKKIEFAPLRSRKAKHFLTAVLHEHQSDRNAKNTVNIKLKAVQKIHRSKRD